MDNGLAMIIVAVITTMGGIMVALIQSLRKENREDHAIVRIRLAAIKDIAARTEKKVDTVKKELHDHLSWHNGGNDGEVSGTNKGSAAESESQTA
jgi:hypothetical protein